MNKEDREKVIADYLFNWTPSGHADESERNALRGIYDAGYAAALGEREPDVCEACAKADEEEAAMLADPNSEFRQAFENRHDIARVIKEPAVPDDLVGPYGTMCCPICGEWHSKH